MNTRLLDVIKYRTGGRHGKFAELLGWSPQYLAKLLRGENFGLQPVRTLLEKLPEIDARWFLFGTGTMLADDKLSGIRRRTFSRVETILSLERFLPVMTPEQLRRFEQVIAGDSLPDFSEEEMAEWEVRLGVKKSLLDIRVEDAMSKSMM